MTSKCGFVFFNICVVHRVTEMLSELSAKWRDEMDSQSETNLWHIYRDCVTHKYNKTSGEELIKTKLKAMCDDAILTAEQDAKLTEHIKAGWEAFIAETPVHYCGDKWCDGECGVQPCGACIDVCRCHCYRGGRDRYEGR